MGYKIIKKPKNGVRKPKLEFLSISKSRITFSSGLKSRLGLNESSHVVLMVNDDGYLCFDVKDCHFPDSIAIHLYNMSRSQSKSAHLSFNHVDEFLGLDRGRYKITGVDGRVYITNAKVTKTTHQINH